MPSGFTRDTDGQLCCDGVSLAELAEAYGTPLYVYSRSTIEENFRRFDAAFASVPHLVCYATKANSALALLRLVAELGGGADVVSGGELRAVLESGIPAERVVFSGVGKTEADIAAGVEAGILALNAESSREIEKIDACARRLGVVARVALRVNPDIDARSHPYISTGLRQNKFGVDISRARDIFAAARTLPGVRMTGVQAHIGSQIVESEPLAQAAGELAALARELTADGFGIETVDVGGGLGIGQWRLSPEDYAAAVLPRLAGLNAKILVEPGRAIVGTAGTLLARVLYVKEERGRTFVVIDAGMNDLLRPALYQAPHPIESVASKSSPMITADVVGPVCETADCFQRDARLPRPEEGELVAIGDAGAYGAAMSSNYNFRSRPAEVLVESGGPRVIRRRESFEDLTRLERT
jgi:diaminopimelate decarboxylase